MVAPFSSSTSLYLPTLLSHFLNLDRSLGDFCLPPENCPEIRRLGKNEPDPLILTGIQAISFPQKKSTLTMIEYGTQKIQF